MGREIGEVWEGRGGEGRGGEGMGYDGYTYCNSPYSRIFKSEAATAL